MGLGLISLVVPPGPWENNLVNAHPRIALPSRILDSLKPQPAPGSVESTSTLRAGSSPLIDLHTKNPVSGDGVPPEPACAPVADSASIPIPASTPDSTLRFMMVLLV